LGNWELINDLKFFKGTSTVKEFYAKNHKWTEGLVSAAKLVGLGANVLM
jgi:huntingtin interacting protein 1